jgi:hypothetical protein
MGHCSVSVYTSGQRRAARSVLTGVGIVLISVACGCQGFFIHPALTAITVTPPTPSVRQNTSLQLIATGTFEDGTVNTVTGSIAWSTSDPSKVTVSSTGVVTGINPGSAIITASSGNVSGSTTVGVTVANLVSIQISPSRVSGITGQTTPFRAVGTLAGGGTDDITDAVVWSANNPRVTISNSAPTNGQAQLTGPFAAFPVQVTITATSGNLSATATLTITQ